jgi:hypothetical protein
MREVVGHRVTTRKLLLGAGLVLGWACSSQPAADVGDATTPNAAAASAKAPPPTKQQDARVTSSDRPERAAPAEPSPPPQAERPQAPPAPAEDSTIEPATGATPEEPAGTAAAAASEVSGVETGRAETPASTGPIHLAPDVEIVRVMLAEDIKDHGPVGVAASFEAGTRVNVFMELRNQSPQERTLAVAWRTERNGKVSPATTVRMVKSKSYKTRAFRTVRRAGSYTALITDPTSGDVVAALPFHVVDPAE